MIQTADKIIYKNTVIMKGKAETGLITRVNDQTIIFQCLYDRDGYVTSKPMLPVTKITIYEGMNKSI